MTTSSSDSPVASVRDVGEHVARERLAVGEDGDRRSGEDLGGRRPRRAGRRGCGSAASLWALTLPSASKRTMPSLSEATTASKRSSAARRPASACRASVSSVQTTTQPDGWRSSSMMRVDGHQDLDRRIRPCDGGCARPRSRRAALSDPVGRHHRADGASRPPRPRSSRRWPGPPRSSSRSCRRRRCR